MQYTCLETIECSKCLLDDCHLVLQDWGTLNSGSPKVWLLFQTLSSRLWHIPQKRLFWDFYTQKLFNNL